MQTLRKMIIIINKNKLSLDMLVNFTMLIQCVFEYVICM